MEAFFQCPVRRKSSSKRESLPVEDWVLAGGLTPLLRTSNPPDAEKRPEVGGGGECRPAERRSGRVTPLSGDEVLARARERSPTIFGVRSTPKRTKSFREAIEYYETCQRSLGEDF